MQKKTLISLIFLVIIIMFSFPWITISCASQPVMNATGFQLASGNYGMIGPEGMADLGINASDVPSAPNAGLILVLILSGIGIVAGLTTGEKIAHKISAWLSSIISVIFIILWITSPRMFYSSLANDPSAAPAEIAAMRQIIQFHFRPAFYFAIILAASCAFLSFYAMEELKKRKLPIDVSDRSPGPVPDESDFIFCPNCGARNPINNKYCSKCGVRLPERRR